MTPGDRQNIGERRLLKVLSSHTVAVMRTLEQKISDAGPSNLRVDPHVLTKSRAELLDAHKIARLDHYGSWFHLPSAKPDAIQKRLAEMQPLRKAMASREVTRRIGDAGEIAVYRALKTQTLPFFGAFTDLDAHGDDEPYSKEEPPSTISGNTIPGKRKKLDFVLIHPQAGPVGLEVKNIREWLYPDREEITELLFKCLHLDAVPVLIGRRIPFVTFKVLSPCGLIVHQTYNQRFAQADGELAAKAAHKKLLGFHDIRVGNEPDDRLIKFTETNLPSILIDARARFESYKDLLWEFATGRMEYYEFAARVRRREAGQDEDFDPE